MCAGFGQWLLAHAVLQRFKDAGLLLKPKKRDLLNLQVSFQGNMVDGGGIHPDPVKIAAVNEWAVPEDITFSQEHFRFSFILPPLRARFLYN